MEAKDNENNEVINDKTIINENEIINDNIEEIQNSSEDTIEHKLERGNITEEGKKSKARIFFGAIKRIAIVVILLAMSAFALKTSKYYINNDITEQTNLIINNNNVTSRLKEKLIIKNGVIYLSMKDIDNYFDNYIYKEEDTNKIITTYDENIAQVGFSGNYINVNGVNKRVDGVAIKQEEEIYLPISEMQDIYNMEFEYIEETDIVTIDSIKRKQVKAEVSKNISVKDYAKVLSRTIDKLQTGDTVIVISKSDEGWTKVRTPNGKIGFIKTNKLQNEVTVREGIDEVQQIDGKISMFWDYYSESAKAPDRTGEKYAGVNVVSPAFFYINDDGKFIDKVDKSAKEYIEWAHDNGYKVWPMLSNVEAGIKVTSRLLNSYDAREELIEDIVEVCEEYDLDGINIDFENMYEDDKNVFSRFMIELTPRMKEIGVITSVDVTAPDGSPNWSLCYDRTLLGNTVDYIVFMAYDQYGTSSNKAGTTAGYNWVETNLVKFIETYEVPSEKIILGIPFYTRLWTEASNGKLSSEAINMKNVEKNIPKNATKTWNDTLKQYYVEFAEGSKTKKMWIEDLESIEAKVSLVSKYNLAGVSAWEKDRELPGTWELIKKELGN